jgi:hypothetical protein
MESITVDNIRIFFSGQSLGNFFMKSFGIVFSILFITYAVISYKQVQEVTRAVINRRNAFITLFFLLQIGLGLFMLFFAIIAL